MEDFLCHMQLKKDYHLAASQQKFSPSYLTRALTRQNYKKKCINVHWSAAGMLWAVWAVKRTWDLPYIGKALRSHNMLVSYLIYTYFARLLTSLRGSLPHWTWCNLHIRLWANAQKYNQSTFEHFMGFRLKVSLFWLNLQFIFSFKYVFFNS